MNWQRVVVVVAAVVVATAASVACGDTTTNNVTTVIVAADGGGDADSATVGPPPDAGPGVDADQDSAVADATDANTEAGTCGEPSVMGTSNDCRVTGASGRECKAGESRFLYSCVGGGSPPGIVGCVVSGSESDCPAACVRITSRDAMCAANYRAFSCPANGDGVVTSFGLGSSCAELPASSAEDRTWCCL